MTKWFWDALTAIARVYVENGHPYLGAFIIFMLSAPFALSIIIASSSFLD